jgi:hypothetical protein
MIVFRTAIENISVRHFACDNAGKSLQAASLIDAEP